MLKRVIRVGMLLAWTAAVGLTFLANAQDHPLRLSSLAQFRMQSFVPQGWAFFTRDAQEPVARVFGPADGGWVRLDYRNSAGSNWFGIKKDTRPIGIELAHLLLGVTRENWTSCESGDVAECIAAGGAVPLPVENGSLTRRFCGTIAVDNRRPVPWAWSRRVTPERMPSEHVVLEVSCA
jgi:antimicrobial peptide system SdpA family protein